MREPCARCKTRLRNFWKGWIEVNHGSGLLRKLATVADVASIRFACAVGSTGYGRTLGALARAKELEQCRELALRQLGIDLQDPQLNPTLWSMLIVGGVARRSIGSLLRQARNTR